ncbi:hypothetical protein LPJ61_005851 [Coemansia biformis]|uniref:Uncharacterized protein n=1 Tax=Coemansia biformis TaxID=1286918 RepID=A0A9W8CRV0_9FUNG|nr:hypothetical protein LPJ61_005851 [Coemansia biformis]
MNPFQHAFGFSMADAWGLINCYVDNQWPARTVSSDCATFKKDLLVGLLRFFDGYRIGTVPHIFSPHAVVHFLLELESIKSSSEVPFGKHDYWARTGSLLLVERIRGDAVDGLEELLWHLIAEYHYCFVRDMQDGVAVEVEISDTVDVAVGNIDSQETPESATDMPRSRSPGDNELQLELQQICMVDSPESFRDILHIKDKPLSARSAIRLLYQAGYLAPIAKDKVGIPNNEVLEALKDYLEEVLKKRQC